MLRLPMVEIGVTGLDGSRAANYTLSDYVRQEFTVKRAAVTKPAADPTTYTYNGEEQTYRVVGGGAEHFEVKDNVKKDANESGYTVTVSLTDKDNYLWEGAEESTDDLTLKPSPLYGRAARGARIA